MLSNFVKTLTQCFAKSIPMNRYMVTIIAGIYATTILSISAYCMMKLKHSRSLNRISKDHIFIVVKEGDTTLIVTAKLCEDSLTDCDKYDNRMDKLFDKFNAEYMTNKVKVIRSENQDNPTDTKESARRDKSSPIYFGHNIPEIATKHSNKSFKTNVDVPVFRAVHIATISSIFDKNPEKFMDQGIHFFKNKERAKLYGKIKVENGIFRKWDIDGNIIQETFYKDNMINGTHKIWNIINGKRVEVFSTSYINDKLDGNFMQCDGDGIVDQCIYSRDKLNGKFTTYDGGYIIKLCHYIDGKLDGVSMTFDPITMSRDFLIYDNGELKDEKFNTQCSYLSDNLINKSLR
jgi:antitoxin component YwqK of YwqJK toxin-antitoxin module